MVGLTLMTALLMKGEEGLGTEEQRHGRRSHIKMQERLE
jgi:hypothetical protein